MPSALLDDAQLPQHPPSHQADLELGCLFLERISRIERRDDVRLAGKNLVQKDCWLQLVKEQASIGYD